MLVKFHACIIKNIIGITEYIFIYKLDFTERPFSTLASNEENAFIV